MLCPMCNDFQLKAGIHYLIETFRETQLSLSFPGGLPNIEPREDVRITDRSPIVRMTEQGASLELARPAGKTGL